MNEHYPFSLPPLPYAYDALSPHLNPRTLALHHDVHLSVCIDTLNSLLAPYPEYHDWPLPRLILESGELPAPLREDVRNNAGCVYNHLLYFDSMTPPHGGEISGALRGAMIRSFGSMSGWRDAMRHMALDIFGSGYAWLAANRDGDLRLVQTTLQNTPLPLYPLLCIDMWEHAYYLQYQNRRGEYVDNWLLLIDWEKVSARYHLLRDALPPYPLH